MRFFDRVPAQKWNMSSNYFMNFITVRSEITNDLIAFYKTTEETHDEIERIVNEMIDTHNKLIEKP